MKIYQISKFQDNKDFDYEDIIFKIESVVKALEKEKILIICGATGTGKSEIALHLAKKLSNEGVDISIINADSMQVYREVPIITAQPTKDQTKVIDHKLYGIVSCGENFSVGKWLKLANNEITYTIEAKKIPIFVGGSGMYIKSLIEGLAEIPEISSKTELIIREFLSQYSLAELHQKLELLDPISAQKIKISDTQRILRALAVFIETNKPISEFYEKYHSKFKRKDFFILYINPLREIIYKNINSRFINMINSGVIEEIQNLLSTHKIYPKIIGLNQIKNYVEGNISLDIAIDKAQQITRNYAKRQLTWFNNQMTHDLMIQ